MLDRYIPVLVLLAGNELFSQTKPGIPGPRFSFEDAREALEAEATLPTGRFSFEKAREALETACHSPVSTTHKALCWNDRGLWHQLQGQYKEAEIMYVRAVSSFEKAPSGNQRLLATTLHNLGATYRELRRFEEAKRVLHRALALRRDTYGEEHPLTANTLGQLGTVHLAAGDLSQAEALLQSAFSVHERSVPRTYPDRVSIIHNLAQLRIAQNNYTSAIKLLQEIIAPSNGEANSLFLIHAAPCQTLAALYRRLGQPARALPLLKKAQRLYEDSFGPDDLTVALVRVEFGLLSAAERNNQLAKSQLQDARARLVTILGPDHPQVASVDNNLAVVCLDRGDLAEASVLLEHAIQTIRRAGDAPPNDLGTYLFNMAEVKRRQGKLQESEVHLTEAVRLLDQSLPPNSPELLRVLKQYATLLKASRSPQVRDVTARIKALRARAIAFQGR